MMTEGKRNSLKEFAALFLAAERNKHTKTGQLMQVALDYLEQGDGWISCGERMPPDNEPVLTWDGSFRKIYGTMFGEWQCWQPQLITHWQPLPSPPEDA